LHTGKGMRELSLAPSLAEVYAPDTTFTPVAPSEVSGFMRRPRATGRDAATAPFTTLAGALRLVASAGAVTPEGNDFLSEAGVPVATRPVVYRGEAEYAAILERLRAGQSPIAFQHWHPAAMTAGAIAVVPPDILSWLNNKASLGGLVPPDCLPKREILSTEELERLPVSPNRPVVIKGCTPLSTGSAGAVAFVRSEADLHAARTRLAAAEAVAVEEYLDLRRVWCLNFATVGPAIRYLGAGEQVAAPDGCYLGNWFGADAVPPEEAVALGHEVMAAGVARGYRGFAGFDIARATDGRLLALDLNFRVCGSTMPLLLWEATAAHRPGSGRCVTLLSTATLEVTLGRARQALEAGWLLPGGVFDPAAAGWEEGPIEIRSVVLGADRDDIADRLDRLARLGLSH
jgi:hypothetical protein